MKRIPGLLVAGAAALLCAPALAQNNGIFNGGGYDGYVECRTTSTVSVAVQQLKGTVIRLSANPAPASSGGVGRAAPDLASLPAGGPAATLPRGPSPAEGEEHPIASAVSRLWKKVAARLVIGV